MLEQLQKQDSSLSKCYRNTLLFYYFSISVQKCPQKAQYRLLARKINKTSTAGISQISSLSSLQGQTPCGSETSSAVWSEDNSEINLTSSDAVSESAQAKEQPSLFPCKLPFLTANIKWFCFWCYQGEPTSKTLLSYTSGFLFRHVALCTSLSVPSLVADWFKDNIILCDD